MACERLVDERRAIEKSGQLHLYHWGVVVLSLILTIGAWDFSKRQVVKQASNRFSAASTQVVALIKERMKKYEDGMWGGVSTIQAQGGTISYDSWRVFSANLKIDLKYPGINGIGVIRRVMPTDLSAYLAEQKRTRPDFKIHPAHAKPVHFPITYIEPAEVNAEAVGLDVAYEANRYAAAILAQDTGDIQITGPIFLVQDKGHTPGFLFYAPYYSDGHPATVQQRQERLLGLVYAPFVFHKLIDGLLEKDSRHVRFSVRDGDVELYNENSANDPEHDSDPMFSQQSVLSLYGRSWAFDVQTTQSFRTANENSQPIIILGAGLTIDGLLLSLFIFLSKANRRAIRFADRMSEQHEAKANDLKISEAKLEDLVADLQRANRDLKQFAFVASHDLQEPLRKLQQFTDFLAKDYSDSLDGDGKYFLDVICSSSRRMSHLIRDLLSYSRIANRELHAIEVDVGDLVADLISEFEVTILETNAVIRSDGLPTLHTDRIGMEQLMRNLIGNALKYSKCDTDPVISITGHEVPERNEFELRIADNGIGFDMQYADRILEPFKRLHDKSEYPGSGIGLAVCNTTCERNGWSLSAHGITGEGATFSISMPQVTLFRNKECSREHKYKTSCHPDGR